MTGWPVQLGLLGVKPDWAAQNPGKRRCPRDRSGPPSFGENVGEDQEGRRNEQIGYSFGCFSYEGKEVKEFL